MAELDLSIFKDLSPKVYDLILFEKDIKVCQGCQEQDVRIKKWVGNNTPVIGNKLNLDSYGFRSDIYHLYFGPYLYGINEKMGIYVKHLPNQLNCYNYEIKKTACIYL